MIFKDYIYQRKRIQQFEMHDLYLRLLKFVRVFQVRVINKALQQIYTEVRRFDRNIADKLLGFLDHFRVCHDQTLTAISDFYADVELIEDRDLVGIAITLGFLNFQPTKKLQSRLNPSFFSEFLRNESIEIKEKYRCLWYCILKGLLGTPRLM